MKAIWTAVLTVFAFAITVPLARAEEGSVINRLLDTVGTYKDGKIYDSNKMLVGTYKDGKIYDAKMVLVGTCRNGMIHDSKDRLVGTYRDKTIYPFLGADIAGICSTEAGVPAAAYLLFRLRASK